MAKAWPRGWLVHLPVHPFWLDQIEIYYSIVQRKVLTLNELTDLDALTEWIANFQAAHSAPYPRADPGIRLKLTQVRPCTSSVDHFATRVSRTATATLIR